MAVQIFIKITLGPISSLQLVDIANHYLRGFYKLDIHEIEVYFRVGARAPSQIYLIPLDYTCRPESLEIW